MLHADWLWLVYFYMKFSKKITKNKKYNEYKYNSATIKFQCIFVFKFITFICKFIKISIALYFQVKCIFINLILKKKFSISCSSIFILNGLVSSFYMCKMWPKIMLIHTSKYVLDLSNLIPFLFKLMTF